MKHKILFTDLDETLLNHDKSISKKNRDAIAKMLEQGHDFVLMTGRPIATGRLVVKELGLTLPRCYMVAFNGAVIYDCVADRILAERTLPMEVDVRIHRKFFSPHQALPRIPWLNLYSLKGITRAALMGI